MAMTKSRQVLKRVNREGPRVMFGSMSDYHIAVPIDEWRLYGKPNEITVTIEPGDMLNPS